MKEEAQRIEITEKGKYLLILEEEFNSLKCAEMRTASVGQTIINYRKKRGMKQKELAKEAEITPATLCRIENEQVSRPRESTLKRLSEILEIDIEKEIRPKLKDL